MPSDHIPEPTYLGILERMDSFPRTTEKGECYTVFFLNDPSPHGYMLPSVVERLQILTRNHVDLRKHFGIRGENRSLIVGQKAEGGSAAQAVNAAFEAFTRSALSALRPAEEIGGFRPMFKGIAGSKRELLRVQGAIYNEAVYIDRFVSPLFGLIGKGVHMTVFTRNLDTDEVEKIWVARRSPHLVTFPNKLDSSVAGGIADNDSPFTTVVREALEEASIPLEFSEKHVQEVGFVSYISNTATNSYGEPGLIVPTVLYCCDMQVDDEMVLKPNDAEVRSFAKMTVVEVKRAMMNDEFKTNSAGVMVDFFVRHKIITVETDKDYAAIVARLRRSMPFPTGIRDQD
jgi:8-oxo-dGTP pyrophosphatase MutT (NUDIX family)